MNLVMNARLGKQLQLASYSYMARFVYDHHDGISLVHISFRHIGSISNVCLLAALYKCQL